MALMPGRKLRSLGNVKGEFIGYAFNCPGCKMVHAVYLERMHQCWTFDGNHAAPTFNPSLLVSWDEGAARVKRVCHSFIRAGIIQFLSDCTHHLAGQNIPIPEWEGDSFSDGHPS